MIFLLVAGALIVGAPILAAMLVSVASLREDAARSLGGRPPGVLAATARRLLSLRADGRSVGDQGRAGNAPAVASPALTGARLQLVPAQRLADHEQADHIVPVPGP